MKALGWGHSPAVRHKGLSLCFGTTKAPVLYKKKEEEEEEDWKEEEEEEEEECLSKTKVAQTAE